VNQACARALAGGLFAILCGRALADAPPGADLELARKARAALAEVVAFEQLNAEITKRCGEPVKGAWADWRDEFHADVERARALGKALEHRAPGPAAERSADERLKPFTEVEGQALYARCLRWSTLLIQHESPLRAGIAARLGFLKDHEAELRAILADDAKWREWRAAGSLP
jgi:hypothetical protein